MFLDKNIFFLSSLRNNQRYFLKLIIYIFLWIFFYINSATINRITKCDITRSKVADLKIFIRNKLFLS